MALDDADDEILQDFLIEATEILEQLNDQLLELEKNPDDQELLNAVFRGFHTIKGGASFLSLDNLVEVCHVSEDIFNQLRNGEKQVDANLMDVILRVLDTLNDMFETLRGGEEPGPAEAELLEALRALRDGAPLEVPEPPAPDPAPAEPAAPQEPAAPAEAEASSDDEITEEEFDALLDQLHGPGKFRPEAVSPAASEETAPQTAAPASASAPDAAPNPTPATQADDEITEEEFEALLDQLHGPGKFRPEAVSPAVTESPQAAPAPPPDEAAPSPPPPEPAKEAPAPPPAKAEAEGTAAKKEEKGEKAGKADRPKKAAKPKEPAQGETTVRVDTKRLDDIMNMVGELVLVRNRLVTLESSSENEMLAQAISNLDLVTADLQAAVMKTRMQPIKKVFGRFPRVVRDLARSLKKEVNLELRGEDTDLDKNLVEALADPLVHLVRNAVDHGIEMPDEREAKGKPRAGTVILSAAQEGDHILLTISDDGKGMDPDMLRRKAVEKGILDEEAAARLDDKEAFALIFAPGFSTKEQISDISGRGVGMDVVKTRIVQLNGSVEIDSEKDVGTTIVIKVPLTLAIMPTLMVMLGNQTFALPLVSVSEIFDLDMADTNTVDGQLVVMVREKPLPLYFLNQWLLPPSYRNDSAEVENHVVVVNVGNQKVGFVVERLIGQEEVVIKPLGALLHGVPGLAGATITGDGRIALILDVPSLIKAYAA